MAAAQKLAKSAPVGKTFVVMLPDTGERFCLRHSSPMYPMTTGSRHSKMEI